MEARGDLDVVTKGERVQRVKRILTRLWARVGRRGIALLFFAFLDAVYCFSLARPAPEQRKTATVLFIESLAPLWLWSMAWGAAGVACFVCAFLRRDYIGFAAAAAINTLWGLLFLVGAFYGVPRAYVSAALWLTLAGWVGVISTWPEPGKPAQNGR